MNTPQINDKNALHAFKIKRKLINKELEILLYFLRKKLLNFTNCCRDHTETKIKLLI